MLTKWELTKWEVDKVGIDKVGLTNWELTKWELTKWEDTLRGYLSVAFLGFHSRVLGQQLLPKVPDKRGSLATSTLYFFTPEKLP